MKLCFVVHCNFRGNSAMHVFSVATELTKLGHECVVVVPDSPESVHEHGEPVFEVLDYDTARSKGVTFADSQGPDFVHAWTPREHVRRITVQVARQYRCRHVVHMEDNEEQIVRDELQGLDESDFLSLPQHVIDGLIGPYRSHPQRSRRFIETAAGYSCLIDNLLELKPTDVPGVVFWPGFDTPFENVSDQDRGARARYGLDEHDIVILYSGNVHASIATDIQKLYATIGLLRQYGLPVKLVRTGWNGASLGFADTAAVSDYVIKLGFVPREDVPVLVGMSDILIQPGRSDPFNDYRFPSKLPEYLVSGRPVILPDSNIGKVLEDGKHVLKLYDGSIKELLRAVQALVESPSLRQELGRNARAFAREYLTWPRAAASLDDLYRRIAATPAKSALSYGASNHEDMIAKVQPSQRYPVKLVAFWHPDDAVDQHATIKPGILHDEAVLAREHGLHGFCFHEWARADNEAGGASLLDTWLSSQGPDFSFSVCWNMGEADGRSAGSNAAVGWREEWFVRRLMPTFGDRRYMRVDGAPLLLIRDDGCLPDLVGATQVWRRLARDRGIDRLHLCAIESAGTRYHRPIGFDAAVEASSPGANGTPPAASSTGRKGKSKAWSSDYIALALRSMNQPPVDHVRYKCVLPPGNGVGDNRIDPSLINDSPKAYGQWLRYLVREAILRRRQQEPLVFVDGWNRGAIGTRLRPSRRSDQSILEVTYDALSEGIIDYGRGPTPEREREFTARIARLPLG